nr:hypothetical protein CFP56_04493 [Quercus suber]
MNPRSQPCRPFSARLLFIVQTCASSFDLRTHPGTHPSTTPLPICKRLYNPNSPSSIPVSISPAVELAVKRGRQSSIGPSYHGTIFELIFVHDFLAKNDSRGRYPGLEGQEHCRVEDDRVIREKAINADSSVVSLELRLHNSLSAHGTLCSCSPSCQTSIYGGFEVHIQGERIFLERCMANDLSIAISSALDVTAEQFRPMIRLALDEPPEELSYCVADVSALLPRGAILIAFFWGAEDHQAWRGESHVQRPYLHSCRSHWYQNDRETTGSWRDQCHNFPDNQTSVSVDYQHPDCDCRKVRMIKSVPNCVKSQSTYASFVCCLSAKQPRG